MSIDTFAAIAAGVLGLILGSLATVLAYRVPRHEGIVKGRSRCPHCGAQVAARDNIPVLSYLLLKGRCRNCGARIAPRYPLIEIATATLFVLSVVKFGASLEAVVYAAFFWVLVALTVIDLEFKLLPNRVVFPALIAGAAALTVAALIEGEPSNLRDAALGALVFGGFLFLVAFIYPAGMGGGDVKLAFLLGMFLGYVGGVGVTLVGMFLSFLLGAVIGVIVMVATGGGRKLAVPFGPFLAGGTILAIFIGRALVDAYLGTV